MKSRYSYALLLVCSLTSVFTLSSKAQSTTQQNIAVSQSQTFQTIKLKVSGITCAGDSKDIQQEVIKLAGVNACKQVGKPAATSVFAVTFDPAKISEKEIRKQVEATPGCENPDDRPYKVKG